MELEKSWETWTRSETAGTWIVSDFTEYASISSLLGNQSCRLKIQGHVRQLECNHGIWSGQIADTTRNDTISLLFSESVSALLDMGMPIINVIFQLKCLNF